MTEIVGVNGHTIDAPQFRTALIRWGKDYFRPFPWRLTRNPFHMLIAEIMLQRTQADQVVPVYERFIKLFPDPSAVAQATQEQLLALLYPLGLPYRARVIRGIAVEIVQRFQGRVPENKQDLLSLIGVGEYTAGAVLCFAWNRPELLIDTNTVRVTGRLFGLEFRDSSRRNPLFRRLIAGLLYPEDPRAYNYALLDLAEYVCTKQRPAHELCPVLNWCAYGASSMKPKQETEDALSQCSPVKPMPSDSRY